MTIASYKLRLSINLAITLTFLAACQQPTGWQTPLQPVEIARLPTYTEGVVVDHDGNLYVSHADRIRKVTPGGQVAEWGTTPSPNGHKILADGTHLVGDRGDELQTKARSRRSARHRRRTGHAPSIRFTSATSSSVENGFVTYPSAPIAIALATSVSRPFAVSIRILVPARSRFSRILRTTW